MCDEASYKDVVGKERCLSARGWKRCVGEMENTHQCHAITCEISAKRAKGSKVEQRQVKKSQALEPITSAL